ncbi:E2F-associated phosphoprotein [Nannochloropsis gaditana]|uniref:E2F-associated phosphoprotein n=1 Tax=Nannochloropsis gaditana TaxID=72520 RepID=W7TXV7_9STRA|nr:E2F-associated phosphoprotein [Nannochloropsis gaditana]
MSEVCGEVSIAIHAIGKIQECFLSFSVTFIRRKLGARVFKLCVAADLLHVHFIVSGWVTFCFLLFSIDACIHCLRPSRALYHRYSKSTQTCLTAIRLGFIKFEERLKLVPPYNSFNDPARHRTRKIEYRAIFVSNCVFGRALNSGDWFQNRSQVSTEAPFRSSATLTMKSEGRGDCMTSADAVPKKQESERTEVNSQGEQPPAQTVACATCGTLLGVQDEEDIVHFLNVIASH